MWEPDEEFVHASNMLRYMRELRQAPDPLTRKTLMTLLAEEAAKARAAGLVPHLFDWSLGPGQGDAGFGPR